ncbi:MULTISPECIES: flagellar filament outer layer protein FlaA [unclassified Oceanispirochaeta]|uniref:flagellar filament outer layer protein FlaA n=1 Tax=unclassified Oceanispirochaeta TaxID=2635722 RepID=UPI000E0903CE|nr:MULTISPECIES: flagellar filament outer layer protein FlaA [unclassified Oceanispirochaeta]MBF9017659.1 flagellar filament outer layer protein FlaA [Oceanispirochaeta sp. M2]NPD74231.1 flagellar protein [Oceanispirochaeta sp. M1]RDG29937.1 flagellar protein [Oceanispirochaeta sp. M1]
MKRFFTLLFLAVFCLTGSVFAEETVLINFSDLIDDYQGQNKATVMDFSTVAGTRYTEEEKAAMQTSLLVPNWEVRLTSSSQTVVNNSLSYVLGVPVNNDVNNFATAGDQVMGVRVHFPEGSFNGYAWIKPPFEIPAYATSTVDDEAVRGDQFSGFGVVKNVGVLKSIKVRVYGMNFPMGLGIVLRDARNNKQSIFLSYLDFDGWRELEWQNPNYVSQIRNRELRNDPLYPRSMPALTLDSLYIYRDAMQEGGDFISYIKDISIIYDQAVLDELNSDIDHESTWSILADREEARRNAELKRLGNVQVLRYLEQQKMHSDEEVEGEEATAEEPAAE